MVYSLKAKCQGCAALAPCKDSDNKAAYKCNLGVSIIFDRVGDEAMRPSPDNDKCYKPINNVQLKKAVKLVMERNKQNLEA